MIRDPRYYNFRIDQVPSLYNKDSRNYCVVISTYSTTKTYFNAIYQRYTEPRSSGDPVSRYRKYIQLPNINWASARHDHLAWLENSPFVLEGDLFLQNRFIRILGTLLVRGWGLIEALITFYCQLTIIWYSFFLKYRY